MVSYEWDRVSCVPCNALLEVSDLREESGLKCVDGQGLSPRSMIGAFLRGENEEIMRSRQR